MERRQKQRVKAVAGAALCLLGVMMLWTQVEAEAAGSSTPTPSPPSSMSPPPPPPQLTPVPGLPSTPPPPPRAQPKPTASPTIHRDERSTTRGPSPGPGPSVPRRPCYCDDGQCGCCSGALLQNFVNFAPRQKGCLNITYDPDDFAFGMALSFNDRVLYKNAISAKNPRPLCVPIPPIAAAKLCVRLSNVYFVGRNLHACIDMEAKWQSSQGFQMSFDCIRIGADGVKVVKPEDGAGLPLGVPVGVTPSPDEYDEIPDEQPPETGQQQLPSASSLRPKSTTVATHATQQSTTTDRESR